MNIITKKQLKNIYKIGILVIMITILTASSFIKTRKLLKLHQVIMLAIIKR